ncbi:MAG: hypothetical protein CMM75_11540 [Rhodospirillaceae bacterium]|nr:hypothetical protein [Rhodospirillaceae bacterium]
MKIISVFILLIILLGGGGYVLNESWTSLNALGIAYHGKIALMLGVIGTFLMSAGLMFLVFYSSRRGYDAENYKPSPLLPFRK